MAIQFVASDRAKTALARILHKAGFVTAAQVSTAESLRDIFPIAHFSKICHVDESKLIEQVASDLGMKIIPITKEVTKRTLRFLDNDVPSAITVSQWTSIRAVPIPEMDGKVTLAMANPLDQEIKTSLEFALGRQIEVAIAKESDIMSVLAQRDIASAAFDLDSILYQAGTNDPIKEKDESESSVTVTDISAPPVVRLVNKIFAEAILHGASDIHVIPAADRLCVRIRVDGIMRKLFDVPRTFSGSMISRIKLLASLDISERRRPQDGRMSVNFGRTGAKKDLRISTVPTAHGEALVARIMSNDHGNKDLAELGMSPRLVAALERALKGASKLILVSGPTGSGKTSTLYASLAKLHDGTRSIISIEDPVEHRFDGITQIQVNAKIGLSFAQGLRSILRQDPDVIMVGEIRDGETASIAVQAAQTGHLVLSSIHTNSATNAITRLRDLGVPPYMVAASLGAVVAQRLVRRLCRDCAAPLAGAEKERCEKIGLPAASKLMPVGCPECEGTGYSGRVALYSFIEVTDRLRDSIRSEASETEMEAISRFNGFVPLEESALSLVEAGMTSLSEVERVLGSLERFLADRMDAPLRVAPIERTVSIESRRNVVTAFPEFPAVDIAKIVAG